MQVGSQMKSNKSHLERSEGSGAVTELSSQPLTTAEQVKKELFEQLCNGIQWQRSVEYMIDNGISAFIEIGQGKVLTGLIKRINKDAATHNIGSAGAITNLAPESFKSE